MYKPQKFTVLEARKTKIKVLADSVSDESPFLIDGAFLLSFGREECRRDWKLVTDADVVQLSILRIIGSQISHGQRGRVTKCKGIKL